MALYYELQVFKDVYTLVQKVFLYTQEFPREYKYTLGQDMKRDAIQLVRSIYRANKAKDKVVYLETFLDDFELLKFEIRLCVDMKILSIIQNHQKLRNHEKDNYSMCSIINDCKRVRSSTRKNELPSRCT